MLFFLEVILYLFVLSLGISKVGINIFGGIFGIISLMYLSKKSLLKKYIKESREGYFFLLIFTGGILLNLLSLGGLKSSGAYIGKTLYFLLIPGLTLFLKKDKIRDRSIYILIFSIFIGIVKSVYNFREIYDFKYSGEIRVDSFFPEMRWGSVLMFVMLFILPKLFDKILGKRVRIILKLISSTI